MEYRDDALGKALQSIKSYQVLEKNNYTHCNTKSCSVAISQTKKPFMLDSLKFVKFSCSMALQELCKFGVAEMELNPSLLS